MMTLGTAVGLICLMGLRVAYYDWMGLTPAMAPGVGFYLTPVLLVVVLVFAVPVEAILRKLWFPPTSRTQEFFIGVAYATILVWWAFLPNWEIFIVINPITCRWVVGRASMRSNEPPLIR